jgi:hypothetical protein
MRPTAKRRGICADISDQDLLGFVGMTQPMCKRSPEDHLWCDAGDCIVFDVLIFELWCARFHPCPKGRAFPLAFVNLDQDNILNAARNEKTRTWSPLIMTETLAQ